MSFLEDSLAKLCCENFLCVSDWLVVVLRNDNCKNEILEVFHFICTAF